MFPPPIPSRFPLQPPPPPLHAPRPPVPPSLLNLLSCTPSHPNPLFNRDVLQEHVKSLQQNLHLLDSMRKELELIALLKESSGHVDDNGDGERIEFNNEICRKRVSLNVQEALSIGAAKSLFTVLKRQVSELSAAVGDTGSWEQISEAVRLVLKLQKYRRNKKWKKKKRRRVADMIRKEPEVYDRVDKESDEWRTREIAKDIAKHKMEKMKEIAKLKANEEKKQLESELELVLVVEKLQELRAVRIQKLKRQGHFLPEEDDKFLERVRAAVEEEERQAAAAADTDAAKDAIASAEESRKTLQMLGVGITNILENESEAQVADPSSSIPEENISLIINPNLEKKSEAQAQASGYEALSNLPLEFYHYYHGSNYDLGTLIEVRRTWDAYIRPGGSRIPGHWVQPSPPSDKVWASYLVSSLELTDQSNK